jgi:hypothetical protein
MDEQQRKAFLKETFNTVSTGYDGNALRFFPESAEHLATTLTLRGDEQVLDVATGTGHAALALASRLPQAGRFDAAVCSLGIFFVEDMGSQLAHIAATVRSKGQVAISSFQEGYFDPLKDLMVKRLSSYGVQMPPQTWKRIANEAGCRTLFAQAGLRDVRVKAKNVGYFLEDAYAWWGVIWNAGFRRLVGQLTPSDQERFRREHLEEIAALATTEGVWLDVDVLFTIGMKA